MFKRTESVGHLVNWASRLFARNINRHIKPLGVSAGQLPVLLALAETSGLSQMQMVRRSAIEQSTMAATVVRMEKGGLISRTPDPADGRASRFELTTQGREVLDSLYAALTAGNQEALAGFSDAEIRQCVGLLHRIIANLTRVRTQGRELTGSPVKCERAADNADSGAGGKDLEAADLEAEHRYDRERG